MNEVGEWTVAEWIGVCTAISSLVAGIITLAVTKLWPAYKEFRAERRVDDKIYDDKVVKGYELVVASLRDQLEKTGAKLAKAEVDLLERSIECAKLRAENESQAKELARLQDELHEMRERATT